MADFPVDRVSLKSSATTVDSLPWMSGQLRIWSYVFNIVRLQWRMYSEVLRYLPKEDLAIIGTGSYERVVEGMPGPVSTLSSRASGVRCIPICIEYNGSVSSEEGYFLGNSASFFDWNDCECTTSTGIPIHCDVLGICLNLSKSA
jgi:hypothetical protein